MSQWQCMICEETGYVDRGRKRDYALRQCTRCGTVVIDPLPTAEELARLYTEYASTPGYLGKREKKLRRSRRRLVRLRRLAPGNRLLDVGCNLGYTVAAAKALGMDARGIDIDPVTIAQAKDLFGAEHFEAVNVEDFAARGDKFDILYTAETIEHTLDPHRFMAALSSLLNPGGLLYLTAPDAGHWRVPKDLPRWNEVDPPFHVFLLCKTALNLMLPRHGLSLIRYQINLKPGLRLLARKD